MKKATLCILTVSFLLANIATASDASLINWWKLDDDGGTNATDTAGGFDGTL